MTPLRYLTVQDVLWMNLQVTGRVNHYRFARLEEATFYQYAYGDAVGLIPQAARLLSGLSRLSPFDGGNDATALLATLTFLEINSGAIAADDAVLCGWGRRALRTFDDALTALQSTVELTAPAHGEEGSVRNVAQALLSRYPRTLASLAEATV